MADIERRWYWDRRNGKAYYPVETDGGTVAFVTVWHGDEVAGALDAGALVPVDDLGPDYLDDREAGFDVFDSFRLPDRADLPGGDD